MIENMQPGDKLNDLIATKVMGWTVGEVWGTGYWVDSDGCNRFEISKFKPSQYWEDMRLVVEEMRKRENPFCIDIETGLESYTVKVADRNGYTDIWVIRDSAPHAVAIAALLALAEEDTQ